MYRIYRWRTLSCKEQINKQKVIVQEKAALSDIYARVYIQFMHTENNSAVWGESETNKKWNSIIKNDSPVHKVSQSKLE